MVLVLAPTVMLLLSLAERRFGAAVAGWLAAAPITLAIALLGLGSDGTHVALAAASCIPAQVAFAVTFARKNLAAAVASYVLVALALPHTAGLVLGLPALALGLRLLPEPVARETKDASTLLRVAVTTVTVAAILTAAKASPQLAGVIAAYPTLSTILGVTGDRHELLRGLLKGLVGYYAFALTYALLVPSVPVALAACALSWATLQVPTAAGRRRGPRPQAARA